MQIFTPKENFIADLNKSGLGRYKINGVNATGVTTVTNMQAKGFLINWSASEAYKDCINLSKDKIAEIIKSKQYAHTRKSDNAKHKGTLAHEEVEKFIKEYINSGKYVRAIIEDEEVRTSVERFYDWAETKNVEFLGSEVSVYSEKHFFAGTFDFVCKLDGKLLLGDFKTSKQIDGTYWAQGAAYAIAVEENNADVKFDGIIIVRSILAKEGQVWYEKSSNGKTKKMENEAFEVAIKYTMDKEKAYFLSLLNIYRYSKNLDINKWYEAETIENYNEDDYPIDN